MKILTQASLTALLACLLMAVGPQRQAQADDIMVEWLRFELMTPGGAMPFVGGLTKVAVKDENAVLGKRYVPAFVIRNGEEMIWSTDVEIETDSYPSIHDKLADTRIIRRYRVGFPQYASELTIEMVRGRNVPVFGRGVWRKQRGAGSVEVPLIAFASEPEPDKWPSRFEHSPDETKVSAGVSEISGRWRVRFSESDDDAVGEFQVSAKTGLVTGTFLTTTGDYRYLAGRVDGNLLRLSTFDGAHAFLFKATLQPDGSLKGDFWSGNWWHETWTAVRDDDAALPDAMDETVWRGDTPLEELAFKDLDGQPRSVAQAMDALDADGARATILLVFGSWCPNCADATEYLVELQQRYHARGLRVLGLAFELTGDIERDARQVRIHQEHHGAEWPVLVAGLSDKDEASKAFPVLDKIRSYPTAVFMDSEREAVAIWTGFSGPATGEANVELRRRWEGVIEGMLKD